MLKFEVLKLLEIHWKCQFYYHHVVLDPIRSGGPFGSWEGGGGVRAHPAHLPAYEPDLAEKVWKCFGSVLKAVQPHLVFPFTFRTGSKAAVDDDGGTKVTHNPPRLFPRPPAVDIHLPKGPDEDFHVEIPKILKANTKPSWRIAEGNVVHVHHICLSHVLEWPRYFKGYL